MEVFKDIEGFEGVYQISDLGRVKSLERKVFRGKGWCILKERILKQCLSTAGYLQVCLHKDSDQKSHDVHVLTAYYFVENPNNLPDVNHINGNRLDNRSTQLEWVTKLENNCHREKNKTNTSNFMGVSWDKKHKRWVSQIGINGKVKNLGRFKSELEAYQVRVSFEKQNNISNKYL